MAITKIADLAIEPVRFLNYGLQVATESNAFWKSGIVAGAPLLVPASGRVTHMPEFTPLSANIEVLSDSAGLAVNKISSVDMLSTIHARGVAFGANDLVGMLAGADPLRDIGFQLGELWGKEMNNVLINTAKGALAAAASDLVNDISAVAGGGTIDAAAVFDTMQLLGDAQGKFKVIAMHSAVRNYLNKQDLITFERDSNGKILERYLGLEIVVDDALVAASGVYTTMMFAPAAFGYADGTDAAVYFERDRDILTGEDIVTSRRRFALHPHGYSFTGSVAGFTATNAELATANKWTKVRPVKHARLAALKHKIVANPAS